MGGVGTLVAILENTHMVAMGQAKHGVDGLVPGAPAQSWLRALCIGVAGTYCLFFVVFATRVGPVDQDQFLVFHELQYWNAMLFGLAKQWTPVMCSGLSLAGEPQVPFMSLSMVLGYVLGPFWGIKTATLVYFIIGWFGAYAYAGLWLKVSLQRAVAAALFIGNGFFICRLGAGHVDFIPFLILPLVLWILHQSIVWQSEARNLPGILRLFVMVLGLGGLLSLAVDGSPVAIIHLLFWVLLYSVVLAHCTRSWTPLVALLCAVASVALLDAGYLWPMANAQAEFPRTTADSFTSVLSLIWFALLPVRGKLLPANGLGHELSVFIGPVVAWALWRHRHWLNVQLPESMKKPLLAVTIVSVVMGMGNLVLLHLPRWLSLYDLLRPLPGFRSIGVTGRYWGFLALPLSLLGAAALWRFTAVPRSNRRLAMWMSAALILQLGFQVDTLFGLWTGTSTYQPVPWHGRFANRPETMDFVAAAGRGFQGAFVTPTRGVVDCYDLDDFARAEVSTGTQLIRQVRWDGKPERTTSGASGEFTTWDRIQLRADAALSAGSMTPPTHVQWVLNQAYHANWRLPGCATSRGDRGNLVVDCPTALLSGGPVTLRFFDALSERAASVSIVAWGLWLATVGTSLVTAYAIAAGRFADAAGAKLVAPARFSCPRRARGPAGSIQNFRRVFFPETRAAHSLYPQAGIPLRPSAESRHVRCSRSDLETRPAPSGAADHAQVLEVQGAQVQGHQRAGNGARAHIATATPQHAQHGWKGGSADIVDHKIDRLLSQRGH